MINVVQTAYTDHLSIKTTLMYSHWRSLFTGLTVHVY